MGERGGRGLATVLHRMLCCVGWRGPVVEVVAASNVWGGEVGRGAMRVRRKGEG
jgi:hypothetical protein